MTKLTRNDFIKYREEQKNEFSDKGIKSNVQVIIGVGTCGVAAGARETQKAFESEISAQNIESAEVSETGCMGLCRVEPTVEVRVPGMPSIIYGNVDEDVARKIVRKHIKGKVLINDYIFDKPSMDIIADGGQN